LIARTVSSYGGAGCAATCTAPTLSGRRAHPRVPWAPVRLGPRAAGCSCKAKCESSLDLCLFQVFPSFDKSMQGPTGVNLRRPSLAHASVSREAKNANRLRTANGKSSLVPTRGSPHDTTAVFIPLDTLSIMARSVGLSSGRTFNWKTSGSRSRSSPRTPPSAAEAGGGERVKERGGGGRERRESVRWSRRCSKFQDAARDAGGGAQT
jgi:hypothetical protein